MVIIVLTPRVTNNKLKFQAAVVQYACNEVIDVKATATTITFRVINVLFSKCI